MLGNKLVVIVTSCEMTDIHVFILNSGTTFTFYEPPRPNRGGFFVFPRINVRVEVSFSFKNLVLYGAL